MKIDDHDERNAVEKFIEFAMENEDEFALPAYIEQHADSIHVREQVDGKWGNFALTELPVKLAIRHALRFVTERRIPHRVVTPQTSGPSMQSRISHEDETNSAQAQKAKR